MSAPFDPTKFNLDPDSEETPKQQASKISSSDDILWSIQVPKTPVDSSTVKKTWTEVPPAPKTGDILDTINTPKQPETIDIKASNEKKQVNSLPLEEKQLSEKEIKTEAKIPESTQKVIDINIASLEDIVTLVSEKEYEYVLIEPQDTQVKITFRQDNIDKDIRYVKFPVYTSILFKIKQLTGLTVEDTVSSQEWKGTLKIWSKTFKIASKTASGENGEKIWLKSTQEQAEKWKKQVKKTPLSTIFGFLWAILFVSLVLWSAFITFIVMNASDVQDVQFFIDLWININDVNTFIRKVVNIIFSILLFITSVALSFALFKFFITKKTLKRKKVTYWLLSTFLLIITFAIGISWMAIDQKIKALPNWQEKIYGNLKIFDNDLLISEDFQEGQAILTQTQDLVWPVTLKFDLENYQNSQAKKWIEINKYIWSFWNEEIETFTPTITKLFSDKWNYEIFVTTLGTDINGEEIEQEISNIPAVSVSHIVEITEETTTNGRKRLELDASDLENLWKIKWYFKTPATSENYEVPYPEWTHEDGAEWYTFFPRRLFESDVFVWVSIINGSTVDETINKVFVIAADKASEISGEIQFTQSLENELSFNFSVADPSTWFANGFIDSFEWTIENKTYSSQAEIWESETSPIIKHVFKNYWEQEVSVKLTDSTGKSETITKTITIQKKVELIAWLFITDMQWDELEGIIYDDKTNEYFIDDIGIPIELKLDTKYVKPVNRLYSLKSVTWDAKNDGNIDGNEKTYSWDIPTEWTHNLVVEYTFQHIKNTEDQITLKEFISVLWVKKEAILDLQLEYASNYAPVVVRFDASKSFIKNDDIIKFIYDYGNGVVEERDAINPWHRYREAWDYTIKLTVVGESWKRYSMEKDLILLPPAQEISISPSLKRAPIGQWIDFSSAESAGQIVEYFWDFGDGNISTAANPTHSFKKAGTYTVKLQADFANSNIKEDVVEIEIYEE